MQRSRETKRYLGGRPAGLHSDERILRKLERTSMLPLQPWASEAEPLLMLFLMNPHPRPASAGQVVLVRGGGLCCGKC